MIINLLIHWQIIQELNNLQFDIQTYKQMILINRTLTVKLLPSVIKK